MRAGVRFAVGAFAGVAVLGGLSAVSNLSMPLASAQASPNFLQHVTIAAPGNGTDTHTVDPNGGTVIAGTNFVPTAGRMLLVIVDGQVTSSTPTGWTLPTDGAAVNNTGLYLFTKAVAAGGDTVTTTHNGSDFPAIFDFYEYPAGTTVTAADFAVSQSSGSSEPGLTGMSGVNDLFAVAASGSGTAATWSFSEGVETVDAYLVGDDGYQFAVSYIKDFASSTAGGVSATRSVGGTTLERLLFAVQLDEEAPPTTTTTTAPTTTTTIGGAMYEPEWDDMGPCAESDELTLIEWTACMQAADLDEMRQAVEAAIVIGVGLLTAGLLVVAFK